jgi:histone H3/H4
LTTALELRPAGAAFEEGCPTACAAGNTRRRVAKVVVPAVADRAAKEVAQSTSLCCTAKKTRIVSCKDVNRQGDNEV